eukprot:Awhi_evm1s11370
MYFSKELIASFVLVGASVKAASIGSVYYTCTNDQTETLSTGNFSSMTITDECKVTLETGVSLSGGTIEVTNESMLYVNDVDFSGQVTFSVKDESHLEITSTSDDQSMFSIQCTDESSAIFNGESICGNRRRDSRRRRSEYYSCDDEQRKTLSSGSYSGMSIKDECKVTLESGVHVSGTVKVIDESEIYIDDVDFTEQVTFYVEDESRLEITSSSGDKSKISVICTDESSASFNGESICGSRRRDVRHRKSESRLEKIRGNRKRASRDRHRRSEYYTCDDEQRKTLSSGSYTGMSIEDECKVILESGVTVSGTVKINDESRLYINDVNFTEQVTFYVEDESRLEITSCSDDKSKISVTCTDESSASFN